MPSLDVVMDGRNSPKDVAAGTLITLHGYTYLAANCLVPLTVHDLTIADTSLSALEYFRHHNHLHKAKGFAPEDDSHVWVSAICKVPDDEILVMLRIFEVLPYYHRFSKLDEETATNEALRLKNHPRFKAAREAKETAGQPTDCKTDDSRDDVTIVQGYLNVGRREDAVLATKEEAAVQDDIQVESQSNDATFNINNADPDVKDENITVPAMDIALNKAEGLYNNGDQHRNAATVEPDDAHIEEAPVIKRAIVAVTPINRVSYQANIVGPWNFWTGLGDKVNQVALRADFSSFATIRNMCWGKIRSGWHTNITGVVDSITPLREGKSNSWKVTLIDPSKRWERLTFTIFPKKRQGEPTLPVGTRIPGLKKGDLIIAFHVRIPDSRAFASWDDLTTLFIAESHTSSEIVRIV